MGDVKSAVERLNDKIEACYKAKYAEWMQKPPDCLIARAGEILSAQQILEALPDVASEEDAEYLLRFKDPLEVVSDYWVGMKNTEATMTGDMTHLLWELRDKRDAEQDYELELTSPNPQTSQQMLM